jgi:hypothetical protein
LWRTVEVMESAMSRGRGIRYVQSDAFSGGPKRCESYRRTTRTELSTLYKLECWRCVSFSSVNRQSTAALMPPDPLFSPSQLSNRFVSALLPASFERRKSWRQPSSSFGFPCDREYALLLGSSFLFCRYQLLSQLAFARYALPSTMSDDARKYQPLKIRQMVTTFKQRTDMEALCSRPESYMGSSLPGKATRRAKGNIRLDGFDKV